MICLSAHKMMVLATGLATLFWSTEVDRKSPRAVASGVRLPRGLERGRAAEKGTASAMRYVTKLMSVSCRGFLTPELCFLGLEPSRLDVELFLPCLKLFE